MAGRASGGRVRCHRRAGPIGARAHPRRPMDMLKHEAAVVDRFRSVAKTRYPRQKQGEEVVYSLKQSFSTMDECLCLQDSIIVLEVDTRLVLSLASLVIF